MASRVIEELRKECPDPEIIHDLLKRGVDPNTQVEDFYTVDDSLLHLAASKGSKPILKLLISFGANPNLKNCYQVNAAWEAVHLRDGLATATVKWLHENGCNLFGTDITGKNMLHWVAGTGNATLTEYLLQIGINPHHVDDFDLLTPLQLAEKEGDIQVYHVLARERARQRRLTRHTDG